MKENAQLCGRILNKGFCFISAANFILFLSFYALMPVLPYFLKEACRASDSMVGIVIASYSVACIVVRPLAGWMLDTLRRRPIYLIVYTVFMLSFAGYGLTTVVLLIILLRLVQGLAFGTATAAANTIVTYLVPQNRLGEGVGLYGLSNTVSMALGPVLGLWLNSFLSYNMLFATLTAVELVGLLLALQVPVPEQKSRARHKLSLRNFILLPAAVPALALVFAAVPYGMTTTYIALLAEEYGLASGAGLFYTFMAVGLGLSRVIGGKWVDRWSIHRIILCSFAGVLLSYVLLVLTANIVAFLASALTIGLTFGVAYPAFNILFVRIGGESQRGTATSTYLTAWDTGIGLGIIFGSIIAGAFGNYCAAYIFGAVSVCIGILVYAVWKFTKQD